MERQGKFRKPKRDPFDRKRKVLEQIERIDPKRRKWTDYLDEDEEDTEEDTDGDTEEVDELDEEAT